MIHVPEIPGVCPGIPGYCSQTFLYQRCKFDCREGEDIDSICTADGTWSPYPTCQGDLRDTRDGCDGCPGPKGGLRNRTAEILVNQNTVSDKRVPKIVKNDGGRKTVPSFAGNINIGRVVFEEKTTTVRPVPTIKRTTTRLPPSVKRTPIQSTIRRLGEQPQQQQTGEQRQQQQTGGQSGLSLFDQIKNKISGSQQSEKTTFRQQSEKKTKPTFRSPQAPPASFQTAGQTFGVFQAVDLGGGPSPSPSSSPQQGKQEDFFGEFKTVNLQG